MEAGLLSPPPNRAEWEAQKSFEWHRGPQPPHPPPNHPRWSPQSPPQPWPRGDQGGTLFIVYSLSSCPVAAISHLPHQQECLFPANTLFKVWGSVLTILWCQDALLLVSVQITIWQEKLEDPLVTYGVSFLVFSPFFTNFFHFFLIP